MSERRRPAREERSASPARVAAFEALLQVQRRGSFANLALGQVIRRQHLSADEAATCTELVNGTARLVGTYDLIIEAASGRALSSLQPAVVTILRLAAHEVLSMRTPDHAAVDEAVTLARQVIGQRVTGVVNAIGRKIAARDLDTWVERLAAGVAPVTALARRTHHPEWIAQAYLDLLGDQAGEALAANNIAPVPTLVVRPGRIEREGVDAPDGTPTPYSPFGWVRQGNPADLAEVRQGRVGVQDEGSQVMAWLLSLAPIAREVVDLPWLDLCAGPGGKAALLTGLARQRDTWLLAAEVAPHRARLVGQALSAYPDGWMLIVADGRRPAWAPGSFAKVMADVPCTGLGSLRRRPESRWVRTTDDLADLVVLQADLIDSAWAATAPGGVMAYVTCSPHRRETSDQVHAFLVRHREAELLDTPALVPNVPDSAHPLEPRALQLWPHRHGTDAMFGALLRKPA